jgi:hypothetical protein
MSTPGTYLRLDIEPAAPGEPRRVRYQTAVTPSRVEGLVAQMEYWRAEGLRVTTELRTIHVDGDRISVWVLSAKERKHGDLPANLVDGWGLR